MATNHYVIFLNPDTTSDIYTLFNVGINGIANITSTGEPTIDEIKNAITTTGAGNNDLIYFISDGYISGLSNAQLVDLNRYLTSLCTTNVVDIIYLSNFMDNCLNRVDLSLQPNAATEPTITNYSFTKSVSPNGIGAVAAIKSKWDSFLALAENQNEQNISAKLTSLVMNGEITAGTSQPLIVVPDISEIIDPLDALKTQYCRIEKNFGRSVPNTENLSLFWFICGVSIVVVVAWVLSYYVPRNRVIMVNKY